MNAFLHSSIARGDAFVFFGDDLSDTTLLLDVIGNDGGGKAKRLVSLDADQPLELLALDPMAQGTTAWELAAHGSLIRIVDGRVELDLTPLLMSLGFDSVAALGAGEQLTESFVYAIRVGNGTLSHAHVTVTIIGENDAATITGQTLATLRETDTVAATGTLTVSDPDRGESAARVVEDAASDNGYGTYSVAADGTWSFTLDPAAVAHLTGGDVVTDTFLVVSHDGSAEQLVTITIEGEDAADITAPVLVSLSLNATAFDVSASASSILVRIEATDDQIGFEPVPMSYGNGFITIINAETGGNPLGRGSLPLTGGTLTDGVFEFALPIDQGWPGGTYNIILGLYDAAGNAAFYDTDALAALGMPSQFQIISTMQNDSTAPMLTGFSLSNTVFDLGSGPASVTVSIAALDDLAGFDLDLSGSFGNGSLALFRADGTYLGGRGSLPVTAGTATDATLGFVLDLPQGAAPGEYEVLLNLTDRVGNSVQFDADDLAVLGFDARITIVNDLWVG